MYYYVKTEHSDIDLKEKKDDVRRKVMFIYFSQFSTARAQYSPVEGGGSTEGCDRIFGQGL